MSPLDKLEKISIEYVVAELRSKIYPKQNDKSYFTKLMIRKRKLIESISNENFIPNIFGDEIANMVIRDKVFGAVQYPNFHYGDEAVISSREGMISERQEFEEKDYRYYMAIGSDVQFYHEARRGFGTIKSLDTLPFGKVVVENRDIAGEILTLDYTKIRRVL